MKRVAVTVAPIALLVLAALPLQAAEMKDTPGMKSGASKATTEKAHKGGGTVKGVDAKAGKVSLAHGPIAGLNWPAMTMDFQVKDKAVLKGVTPGQNVEFEIVQTGQSQFVITRIAPAAGKATKAGK